MGSRVRDRASAPSAPRDAIAAARQTRLITAPGNPFHGVIDQAGVRDTPRTHRDRDDPASSTLPRVKKTVLLYGLLGGVLIAALKVVEYRFLVLEHSLEIYSGIVALLFSGLGIWLGLRLTRTRETVSCGKSSAGAREVQVPVTTEQVRDRSNG